MRELLPRGHVIDLDALDAIVDSIVQKFDDQDRYCHDCWSSGCLCLAAIMSSSVLGLEREIYLALCQKWWRDCTRETVKMELGKKHLVEIHGSQPWAVAVLLAPTLTDNLPNYFGGLLASSISYFAGCTQMTEAKFLEECEFTRKQADRQRAGRRAGKEALH